MAGKSKDPVKFPKVNQISRMKDDAIYAVGSRPKDLLNSGKMKMTGGKPTIKQNGGWIVSKKTGKKRHERACVTSEKSPEVMTCSVKGIDPNTGKLKSCKIILGVRETYPDELREQIEKDEQAYNEREKQPRIYTKRKRIKKATKALGRR